MPFEPFDQYLQRQKKLEQIVALGHSAYPHKFEWTMTPAQIVERFGAKTHDELAAEKAEVRAAGRIMTLRLHGKTGFAHIQGDGGQIQIYVRLDVVGERGFQLFQLLDMGDMIGVAGTFVPDADRRTYHLGDGSEVAHEISFAAAGKMARVTDVEKRYRQRYVDLIVTPKTREIFLKRAKLVREMRKFFRCARIRGSGNADDASDRRRSGGASFYYASQHA